MVGTIEERNEGKGEGKGLKRDEEEEEEEEEEDLAEVRPSVRIPPPRSLPAPVSSKGSLEGGGGGEERGGGPGGAGGEEGRRKRDTEKRYSNPICPERVCVSLSLFPYMSYRHHTAATADRCAKEEEKCRSSAHIWCPGPDSCSRALCFARRRRS